jgi:hypothetical protein
MPAHAHDHPDQDAAPGAASDSDLSPRPLDRSSLHDSLSEVLRAASVRTRSGADPSAPRSDGGAQGPDWDLDLGLAATVPPPDGQLEDDTAAPPAGRTAAPPAGNRAGLLGDFGAGLPDGGAAPADHVAARPRAIPSSLRLLGPRVAGEPVASNPPLPTEPFLQAPDEPAATGATAPVVQAVVLDQAIDAELAVAPWRPEDDDILPRHRGRRGRASGRSPEAAPALHDPATLHDPVTQHDPAAQPDWPAPPVPRAAARRAPRSERRDSKRGPTEATPSTPSLGALARFRVKINGG